MNYQSSNFRGEGSENENIWKGLKAYASFKSLKLYLLIK